MMTSREENTRTQLLTRDTTILKNGTRQVRLEVHSPSSTPSERAASEDWQTDGPLVAHSDTPVIHIAYVRVMAPDVARADLTACCFTTDTAWHLA